MSALRLGLRCGVAIAHWPQMLMGSDPGNVVIWRAVIRCLMRRVAMST